MLLVLNVNLCLQICFVIVLVPFVRIVLAFFVIANYYLLNIFIYGTNYFKSQIIIVIDSNITISNDGCFCVYTTFV